MRARVIQGFFIGGTLRAVPGVLKEHATAARTGSAAASAQRIPGPPPPVHAPAGHRGSALQPRMMAGRPPAPGQPHPLPRYGGDASFDVDPVSLGLMRSGGAPLPAPVLAKMESAFGADFSGVRVHVGPQASRIGAAAFTIGDQLYFAPGQYQPDTVHGQQLIGHELAHVIQQRQGRVHAPGSGTAVVRNAALEAEADRLGTRAALQRVSSSGAPARGGAPVSARRTLQAKGKLTTVGQATPHVDSQTYYCEISINGGHNVKGKNGSKSGLPVKPPKNTADEDEWIDRQKRAIRAQHATYFKEISDQLPTFTPRTDDDYNNPHAEDDAIHALVTRRKSQLRKGRTLSVTISAAPCARCAKNLHALSEYFEMPLRIKATIITDDGRAGIRYLAQHRIPFRIWTDAQRDASSRIWGAEGAVHDSAAIIGAIRTRLEELRQESRQAPTNVSKKRSYNRKKRFYDRVSDYGETRDGWIAFARQAGFADADKKWKDQGLSRSGGQWPPRAPAPVIALPNHGATEGVDKRERDEDRSPRKGTGRKKQKL